MLLHCWWECKLIQPLWKTLWRLLKKKLGTMPPCVLSHFSRVRLFVTLWTIGHQAPLSMGFSRKEYWSGSPFPSPGDLPNPGIEPGSPALEADALPSEPPRKPGVMCNVADKDKQTEGEMSGLSDQEEMEKNKYHILMHIYGI